MATSKVLIANMALDHLGSSSTIEALTESSPEAKRCNRWYDHARLETLERFNWGFARKRLAMSLHGDDAPADLSWDYRYQYPADCVAAREIVNPLGATADAAPYTVEISDNGTRSILTDVEDATLVYTRDLENTELFSRHFITALSYRLAFHIAFAQTGKRSVKGDMLNLFEKAMDDAPAQNANESVSAPPREADWIRGR